MFSKLLLLCSGLFATFSSASLGVHFRAASYEVFCVGNCNKDVTTTTSGGIVMMGGGNDVDDAFKWMITNSGGGDFVVLRTSGSDGYNDYIYSLGKVNSVTTIVTYDRTASSSTEVLNIVRKAEALFLAGGDQSTYLNYWGDSPLGDLMQDLIDNRKIPLGGTSAGLHVQGELVYTGQRGSAVSDESLDNPYNIFVTLDYGFLRLPVLQNLVTDSHFYERDRMGRTITFLARLIKDGMARAGVRAISIDEGTALLVDPKGFGQLVGEGYVYMLEATTAPKVCERGSPLTMTSVAVYKLDRPSTSGFDLVTWKGVGGVAYYIDAVSGRLISTQSGGKIY